MRHNVPFRVTLNDRGGIKQSDSDSMKPCYQPFTFLKNKLTYIHHIYFLNYERQLLKESTSRFDLSSYFQFTPHLQCCEMLLSPAGVVEMTMDVAVEWELRALASCDGRGCSVLGSVKDSGRAEEAVAKWGTASASDNAPEDETVPSGTFVLVSGENPEGGADVAVMSSLGASDRKAISYVLDGETEISGFK